MRKGEVATCSGLQAIHLQILQKNQSIAEPTAQVYVIDIIAQGAGGPQEHARLLRELNISKGIFQRIECQLWKEGITLRELKDLTNLSYNQIRGIIAALIHGFNL